MRRALLLVVAAGLLAAAAAPPAAAAAARPPDLVLVTIDTLRADAPGFAGRSPSPTPLLDRLAAAGRVFTSAHAHNVVTLPSHTNILTGLYPYQHGVRDNAGFRLAGDVPTLATALHAAGYATGAFVAAYPLDSLFGLDRGFDVYDDHYPKGTATTEIEMPERPATEVVAKALAWWQAAAGKPRFLWVHVYEPHAPYAPPEPFRSRWKGAPYLGEVATADAALAPLLEPLLASKRETTLVAVTGDHGEALGEHGEETHGIFAYEPTLRVPLLLWGRGVQPGRDARPARHVDVFPTLLAAAGVTAPPSTRGARPGRSLLLPPAATDTADSDSYFEALSATLNRGWAPLRGILRSGHKAIALPAAELYDLPADPAEEHNLATGRRPELRALLAALPAQSAWPPPAGSAAARGAIRSEEAARLRSLGYATGAAAPRDSYGVADDPKNLVGLDRQIRHVLELQSQHRSAEAAAAAREIVAARPTMPMGHSLLAQALLDGDDLRGAVAAMEAARAHGAASDSLLCQLGLTLAELGRTNEAIAVLQPLADRPDPRFPAAFAQALSDAGRQEEAAQQLARALALDPEHAPAMQEMGMVELRRERFAAAREWAEKATAANPRLPGAWNDLGVARLQLGDRDGAVSAWERAVELQPELWDALWNLGTQAAAAGRTDVARRALTSFVAHAPASRYGRDIDHARQILRSLGGPG